MGDIRPDDGLQAEYARAPYAHVGPVRLPDSVADGQAILLVDGVADRLEPARQQRSETVDFYSEDPVEAIRSGI
ncbi:hypothetical protein [Streptomyces sp. NBC_01190]|uniref:hypothetical protein n=1 Tax=Streptomyces sp. NBC_01190 TaxID=2903767 RepID=UPI003866D93D|nr:hypothetical protein OG519_06150 [Streptomyces sp. NBC_01190]